MQERRWPRRGRTSRNAIGASLSTEKKLDRLLEKILRKAREITSADGGSLYLVELEEGQDEVEPGRGRLRFKLAQNDSREATFSEFTLPIDRKSIVGHVTLSSRSLRVEDAYALTGQEEFRHNREFDERSGYRTRSMLVVPMKNQADETLGVLQLINKKADGQRRLREPADFQEQVGPFNETDLELVESLASQASVAIENARLVQDIQKLFEGFIRASVSAIESRDPTTSGHSERVATLTCSLADVVSRETSGPYAGVRFEERDLREIRYASLLHDFGKIGVREDVLTKAKKLHAAELAIIRSRFDFVRRTIELECSQRKVQYLLDSTRERAIERFRDVDRELASRLAELDDCFAFIVRSNDPSVLPAGDFDRLHLIAGKSYATLDQHTQPYLTGDEVARLSIRKGSLSDEERRAIESHVTHSYRFLQQIPWTKDLRRVPDIAHAHHEKLNGGGYPLRLTGEAIPLQSKIMTVADIFDALSARDRPYKKAVPVAKALEILAMEVKDGSVDAELYRLFVEAKVYEKVIGDP